MDLGLKNRTALVAASSKGLGRACAEALAAEGAGVVICARNEADLARAREEISRKTGGEILAVAADMAKPEDIEGLVEKTVAHFGGLHILVTNAGGPPGGDFFEFDDAAWLAAFELSMMSTVRLIRSAVPHMQASKWGRVINITSLSVKEPLAPLVLSNATRPSVHGLAKTLANQLGKDGITVNNIMPGYTRTDRIIEYGEAVAKQSGKSLEEVFADMGKPVPVGRIGEPEELGALAAFLASERAAYITGTSIPVDGGAIRAAF
jgi:3-oxoacyl-[acyl-carrier protein] reductase